MACHSGFSDSSNSLQQNVAARCLALVDARVDMMSDAPKETSEGSLRQLLKGATGYETRLTSSTLAPSLPTKEELGACPDLCNVAPPRCLKYMAVTMSGCCGVSTKRSALLVTHPVELCTDPILHRN